MRFLALMLAALATVASGTAHANPARDKAAVLAVQAQVDDAMRANDADKLAPLLTEDFTRTPPTGLITTKAQWLDLLRTGKQRYLSVERTETDVRLFGDSAIVTGIIAIQVERAATGLDILRNRYLRFYVRQKGRWRLAAHQATEIKAP
jgi:uncharacterized protein (TIGR02246 family)